MPAMPFFLRKKNPLTEPLTSVVKKARKRNRQTLFQRWFGDIYLPTWKSFGIVLLFLLPFILFSHFEKFCLVFQWGFWRNTYCSVQLPFIASDHFQNYIGIAAGIGTIIFALLIFVAESLRDNNDRARVLLRESLLFPITVGALIVLLNFLWYGVNVLGLVPILVVALFTITGIWRLIDVLLNKAKFAKKQDKLFKERMEIHINLAVQERLRDNALMSRLGESKIQLSYYPLSAEDKEDSHHLFHATGSGVIETFNLERLERFAQVVEAAANKNGFSFQKAKPKPSPPTTWVERTPTDEPPVYAHLDDHYLTKKHKNRVTEKDSIILAVDRRAVKKEDTQTLNLLGKIAREVAIIEKEDAFSEEITAELASLRDQFILAINEKRVSKIDEHARAYIKIAEAFWETLADYDIRYDFESARQERSAFNFSSGLNIGWLLHDVRDYVERAIETRDRQVIQEVIALPNAISHLALKFRDQYLYQQFIQIPAFVYWLAKNEDNEKLRSFVIGRTWRHLSELATYVIESEITRKKNTAEDIKSYNEFTIPILQAFQSLIKEAYDNRDLENFNTFLTEFSKLFRRVQETYPEWNYNLRLKGADSEEERGSILSEKAVQEARIQAGKDIRNRKLQILVGLSAWLLEKARENPEDADLKKFFAAVRTYLPTDIIKLTKVLEGLKRWDTDSEWGWSNWEFSADGEVHTVDFPSKINRLYVVQALHSLQSNGANRDVQLTPSRTLESAMNEKHGPLWNIASAIEQNPEAWADVLTQAEIAKVPELKAIFKRLEVAQKEIDNQQVKNATPDASKVTEFKTRFVAAFNRTAIFRKLLKRMHAYEDLTSTPKEDLNALGINTLSDKAAFIPDWPVHYMGWGDSYGEGLAQGENENILKTMFNAAQDEGSSSKDSLIQKLEDITKALNPKETIILEALPFSVEYQLLRSDRFSPRQDKTRSPNPHDDDPNCEGFIRLNGNYIPFYKVFPRDAAHKNSVLVTELRRFGKLTQFRPTDKKEDFQFIEGMFQLKLSDLNQAEPRNELMSQNPPWLDKEEDPEGYLRQRVWLRLFEKFDFQILDASAGRRIKFTTEGDEDL